MALMALRVIPTAQFFQLGTRKVGADLNRLWRLARSLYFSGTDSNDFQKLLGLVAPKVEFDTTDATDAAAERFVASNLGQGRLVIVGIESVARKLNHWVLAIGQEGVERCGAFESGKFLIVDPDNEPDRLVPWNATLDTGTAQNARLYRNFCDLHGESFRVRLSGAIALTRRRARQLHRNS